MPNTRPAPVAVHEDKPFLTKSSFPLCVSPENHVLLETMDITGYLNQYFYIDTTTEVEAGDIIDLVFFDYNNVHFDWTSFLGGITCDYGDLQKVEEDSEESEDSDTSEDSE